MGRQARTAVDSAREQVASIIGATASEIVFTSGGTESDNLAIRGVAKSMQTKGKHLITSQIEHHAVINTFESLAKDGYEVTYLPCDKYGLIDPDDVRKSIRKDTILISIIHGHNEVGTIEPIEEIGKIAKEHGILFHSDAVQSLGKIPVKVDAMGVDLLTISSHKIYGPKGVGALYVRKGTRIRPQVTGGIHEKGLRAGTENVPGIVGFGAACALAEEEMPEESKDFKRFAISS